MNEKKPMSVMVRARGDADRRRHDVMEETYVLATALRAFKKIFWRNIEP